MSGRPLILAFGLSGVLVSAVLVASFYFGGLP